jgi:hypothetical protein
MSNVSGAPKSGNVKVVGTAGAAGAAGAVVVGAVVVGAVVVGAARAAPPPIRTVPSTAVATPTNRRFMCKPLQADKYAAVRGRTCWLYRTRIVSLEGFGIKTT